MTMRRWQRRLLVGIGALSVLVAGVWVNNTSVFSEPAGPPTLLAHRGLGQTFDLEGVDGDMCTAERIHPPQHEYLENTLASMGAAFDAGADVVEFDVHPTKDGRFAVFHDWELDCRTDGTGVTRDHTMAELRRLDVGYGYSADGGRTFPFRGNGIGAMPSLDDVLETFPDRALLIHVKSDDPAEGRLLADRLGELPDRRLDRLAVYGGDAPIAALADRVPRLRVMSEASLKRCLGTYLAVGWTGIVPEPCRNTQLHIPETYARLMWGWPHRFVERMAAHDTRMVVVGGSGEWSEGFDSSADLARLPHDYAGTIWTNRVDEIALIRR